jgi:peroxiredoxin family protein
MAEEKKKRIAIIASKGTLDMAYPPLILATTALSMDMEAGIFFTLYGINILRKDKQESLKVAPLANPAMPVPVPNIMGVIPGMTAMATSMMKGWIKKINWPTIPELLEMCVEEGARLIACSPTMEMLDLKKEDLIDGVEIAGAADFLEFASEADITLFI